MPTIREILDNATIDKVIYSWRNKRTYLGDTKKSHIGPKGSRTLKEGIQELRHNEECVGVISQKLTHKVRYDGTEGDV